MNVYTEALLAPEPWTRQALCAETDPEAFFPEPGKAGRTARKICAACDVREACLGYAIRTNQTDGVWGGTTPAQRHALRRGQAS